jgi:molybdopterin biosynthesis enzyme MoaB
VLIVNLPGSPEGAVTSLESVMDLIPHALVLLSGADAHIDPAGAARR